MAGRLRITQVRSTLGRRPRQRATVRALGLKRVRDTVEHDDGPAVRGMLARVGHLVSWEHLPAGADHEPGGDG